MDYSAMVMTAFSCYLKVTVLVYVKRNLHFNQFVYVRGSFFAKHLNGFSVAKTRACDQRIFNMIVIVVIGGHDSGNSTLSEI